MCLLLETIKVENGRLQNPEYHQARIEASSWSLLGINTGIDLKRVVQIPDFGREGVFKCRVVYDTQIRQISFEDYHPKQIQSLKLVYDDDIEYPYKYVDRQAIDRLFEKRGTCDDILIVKQGLITDTSFCNILFYDGIRWLTPHSALLSGTRRRALIRQGMVWPQKTSVGDLDGFSHFMLINAMLDFDEDRANDISKIR
jgi:4-amino-4-deoxychorismate lyase